MTFAPIHHRAQLLMSAVAIFSLVPITTTAQTAGSTYKGQSVRVGKGSAHAFVRTDTSGKPSAIGVALTEGALEGLPLPAKGGVPYVPFALPMPRDGPRTVVDHVVINWEPAGHPPPKVYDVPHFDFHFYLVGSKDQQRVRFKSDADSGDPSQQPAADLLPTGYIVPPGTAVPQMGVHAINPAAPEFNGQAFTATFIYGYHDKQLTFLEPMAALAFLKTKPTFSAPVVRPSKYPKPGGYPSRYAVNYDPKTRSYEVSLDGLQ